MDNALPVMRWSEKYLGARIFSALARPTFYKQFVGGDTEEELTHTTDQVNKLNGRMSKIRKGPRPPM